MIYKSGGAQNHVMFWTKKLAENVIRSQIQNESWFCIPNSTNNKQVKGVLRILFEKSLKYVWQCREQKYSVWNNFFPQISIERYIPPCELD